MREITIKYKRVVGIDVHKEIHVCTLVIEHEDGSLEKIKKDFKTDYQSLQELANWLHSYSIEKVTMESTGIYWKSVYEVLESAGLSVDVVNARAVKNIPGHKTDKVDSERLALVARFGLVKSSFVPDKLFRNLRLMVRTRYKNINECTSVKNQIHAILDEAGIPLGIFLSDITGVTGRLLLKGIVEKEDIETLLGHLCGKLRKKREQIRALLLKSIDDTYRTLIDFYLNQLKYLEEKREGLEKYILDLVAPYESYLHTLMTIPGFNQWTAIVFLAEIGPKIKQQFPTIAQLCSWIGICPGNNESAGKRKSSRINPGNKTLKRALCEAANASIRTSSQFRDKFKSFVVRLGYKKSLIAIAHKMVRVAYSLLQDNTHYRDPGIDYVGLIIKKNAPRWLKALTHYGYIEQQAKRRKAVSTQTEKPKSSVKKEKSSTVKRE